MVDRELQAEEKNLEASVAFLRAENQREAELLTELLAKKKASEAAARTAESRAITAEARLETLKTAHDAEKAARAALRASRNDEKAEHAADLKALKQEAQDAKTELSTIRAEIDAVTQNKESLLGELAALGSQITAREQVLSDIETLRSELATLESSRDALRLETSQIENVNIEKVIAAAAELDRISSLTAEKTRELSEAESRKKSIDDECQRKSADLLIAIERIEAKYKKAFPNLRLLLI